MPTLTDIVRFCSTLLDFPRVCSALFDFPGKCATYSTLLDLLDYSFSPIKSKSGFYVQTIIVSKNDVFKPMELKIAKFRLLVPKKFGSTRGDLEEKENRFGLCLQSRKQIIQ